MQEGTVVTAQRQPTRARMPWVWGAALPKVNKVRCPSDPNSCQGSCSLEPSLLAPASQPSPSRAPPVCPFGLSQTYVAVWPELGTCPLVAAPHQRQCQGHMPARRPVEAYSPTFFLTSDMTPIRVSTCCLDRPSRGTPSAKVSAPSAPGSHRWRMKSDT